jgi:hypothetical protein
MEKYHKNAAYAILVFHDRYDIPAKGSDGERQWESEEVFEYMICAICPMTGEYEPGKPECGFLFPAFTDRSGDQNHINIYQAEADRPHRELLEILGLGWRLELPFYENGSRYDKCLLFMTVKAALEKGRELKIWNGMRKWKSVFLSKITGQSNSEKWNLFFEKVEGWKWSDIKQIAFSWS